MAELEIHHEHEETHDPMGQRVGVLASVMAVLLAIVTIASHRTHTEAIIARTEANDQWAYYQATRVKLHSLEVAEDMVMALASAHAEDKAKQYRKSQAKYDERSKEIQKEARAKDADTRHAEDRALRYDIGEGLLEIGLVLSSLYFIARKKFFPAIGAIAGTAGIAAAVTGYLL